MSIKKSGPEDEERLQKLSEKVMDAIVGANRDDGIIVLCKILVGVVHHHYKPSSRQEMIDAIHEMINHNHEQEKGDPIDLLKTFLTMMKESLKERMKKEDH